MRKWNATLFLRPLETVSDVSRASVMIGPVQMGVIIG